MGCYGLFSQDLPQAFIERGASVVIGWKGLVGTQHTDDATRTLLRLVQSISKQLEEARAKKGFRYTLDTGLLGIVAPTADTRLLSDLSKKCWMRRSSVNPPPQTIPPERLPKRLLVLSSTQRQRPDYPDLLPALERYQGLYLATNTAFSMLSLSHQYVAATTEAEKSIVLAAGQAMGGGGSLGAGVVI